MIYQSWKIRNVERHHLVVYRIPIKLYIHGSKDIPYIFHITPLNFKTFSWSNSLSEFLEIFTFNSRINENLFSYSYIFFELLITSIYDFNTNVNSRHHNFLWLYSIFGKYYFVFKSFLKKNYKKKKLCLFLCLMLKISWKSDKEWLQENVLKISVFI